MTNFISVRIVNMMIFKNVANWKFSIFKWSIPNFSIPNNDLSIENILFQKWKSSIPNKSSFHSKNNIFLFQKWKSSNSKKTSIYANKKIVWFHQSSNIHFPINYFSIRKKNPFPEMIIFQFQKIACHSKRVFSYSQKNRSILPK